MGQIDLKTFRSQKSTLTGDTSWPLAYSTPKVRVNIEATAVDCR